ncbi:DUF6504 family protein [Janibacter alittae]|uniref:DUF6504 family protein n=1 Tax=Janibacter alittae TaxID=3115209 RepID=A0ABZ2ML29_9MICO
MFDRMELIMVRLVEETIEVRMADPQHRSAEGQPGDGRGGPEQFLWRGRLYLVTEVVAHWQERRPWWRAATEQPLAQVPLARDVWRVSASRGLGSAPGVYDLGVDGAAATSPAGSAGSAGPTWLLLRTQD